VAAVAPQPLDQGLPLNPLSIQQLAEVYELAAPIAFLLLGVLGLASVASLVVRFRRAGGEERQQLKWFTYGAAVLALLLAVSAASQTLSGRIPDLVVAAALAAPPLAIGVAVLRYRLYDIDLIINRTLVYGALTVLLAVIYVGIVLTLGQLFGGLGEDPPTWAVAAATLAVAALFQPARRRIQQAVDRRFNRRKYDTAQTIEAFSARLRDEVDLDTLSAELLAVADQTMQPTTASLWLRPSAKP
jgi:peptidoglycan/LPS O-acetylase OafA/YrhL